MAIYLASLAGGVLAFSSCAFIFKSHVDDLTYSSIALVKADDAPHDSLDWPPQGRRKVLLVSMLSEENIADIVAENKIINAHAEVYICGIDGMASWAMVFQDGQDIRTYQYKKESSSKTTISIHNYELWFDYWNHNAKNGNITYDLAKEPQDLCITIYGEPYLAVGTGLSTNTIIVPKQAVAEALASLAP